MSLDFRLMYVYEGSVMVMFTTGAMLTERFEIGMAAIVTLVLVAISLTYRSKMNWHWPGASGKDFLKTLGEILLGAMVSVAASPQFPPRDHHFLPWYLFGYGALAFAALTSLHFATPSKEVFLKQCRSSDQAADFGHGPDVIQAAEPFEEPWKKNVRAIFAAAFIFLWIAGFASFYVFGLVSKHGTHRPNMTNSAPIKVDGAILFVPENEKQLADELSDIVSVGIPVFLATGFLAHFFLEVKLVSNVPTFSEWRAGRRKNTLEWR
jgi:hypothetical protein